MMNSSNSNWHLMLYLIFLAYRTSLKTATGFSPFQLVYGLEVVLPIECQISSLKSIVELLSDTSPLEECLLYLEHLDEQRRDVSSTNEPHKKRVNCQYDRSIHPHILYERDLVLVYDQEKYPLGVGKFKPMWFRPFIVKDVLNKDAYHLVDCWPSTKF
jgi:hypothetical protein